MDVYGSMMRIRELAGTTTARTTPAPHPAVGCRQHPGHRGWLIQVTTPASSPATQAKMIRLSFPELSRTPLVEFRFKITATRWLRTEVVWPWRCMWCRDAMVKT